MNEPHADTWQQYFAPQVAARNRWATHPVQKPEGRRRSLPRRVAPVVALATGLGFGVFVLTPSAHASTDIASVTFWPTGGEQTFAVPLGVTSVQVATVGGHGGASRVFDSFDGGAGATVSADLDVTGGETLYLEVGGNGTDPTYVNTSDTTYVYTPGFGGFNGGGDAGLRVGGGGGGGASDVRTEPAAAPDSLDSRLIVAGGGGGAGMAGVGGASGLAGASGSWPGGRCVGPGGPGAGGTADAGGAGGSAEQYGGLAGTLGSGGNGGGVDIFEALGGGGGGGGYYGGGGGGGGIHVCGGGGGAGSSYVTSAARSPSFGTDTTGAPRITISYLAPQAPQLLTTAATDVGPTGATLNGVVNPEGGDTTYHFEYWPTSAGDTVLTADAGPLTGTADQRVSAVVTGLAPGTGYSFRLVATNANGTTADLGDLGFATAAALPAPTAATGAASRIGQHRALLHGTVNPGGSATSYYFEYGTTSRYGSTTPQQAAGSGSANVSVSAWASGLRRHTTYHFRVVAVNAQGTAYGADRTFRTR